MIYGDFESPYLPAALRAAQRASI